MTSRDQPRAQAGDPQSPPRVSGDELFVPASHVLVIDRQVSHPAFRLWCVLHRLWFLHEPPVMELLQELMGTTIIDKATRAETWQPATRRSIERWLTELEQAGWLIWARRGETTRRYHLRTTARSATDTAVLTELRTLLNSGKATLTEVQALLNQAPQLPVDATPESHGSIPGSHQDAEQISVSAADATPGSHGAGDDATAESHPLASWEADATVESHDPILASHDTTAESEDTTHGSHDATAESQDTTLGSHGQLTEGVLMQQNQAPYSEILQNEIHEDPTPPPATIGAPAGGDGGGLTATERFLIREGFSTRAAREFRDLDRSTVQADLERRRGLGQGIGAIVTTWRVEPPRAATLASFSFVRKAYLRALDFARQPRGWLLLFGPCGVGKTHLAAAAANQALDRNERVLFAVVPDLLDHLRSTFGPSSEVAYDERFELVRTVPLLILDDLGTESATAWAREKLYQIVNHRYNLELPTVITSNRAPEQLDQRILSRMFQRAFAGEILRVSAEDYRRQIGSGRSSPPATT